MPKFIDRHIKLPFLPPETLQKIRAGVGKKNELGVTPLNAYFTADGGAYCLCEAPDAEAVRSNHEAMGIPLDERDVQEISGSLVRESA